MESAVLGPEEEPNADEDEDGPDDAENCKHSFIRDILCRRNPSSGIVASSKKSD
jgi:hypothetical protein